MKAYFNYFHHCIFAEKLLYCDHMNHDKGCDGNTFFACGERWRVEPRFAPVAAVPLTLAHLLLFHRRLDGCLHTTRAPVPVKIRCESEQTLSVERYMRAGGSIVNAITYSDRNRWPCRGA